MQAINVFENGIEYLSKCLGLYLGSCGYLVLFLCGIVYLLVKGNDEEKEIFVPGAVLMLLTVYNPLFPVLIDKFFDISGEYYRLFWITPVVVLVPFCVSKLLQSTKSTHEKMLVCSFAIVVGILAGNFVHETGIPFAQNVYKIPDELIEIDNIIHADSNEEYPKAFFEYNYNMEIRQYDPKMLLTIDREDYLYAVNYAYTEEMIADDSNPSYRLLAALVRNQNVDPGQFANALEATSTQYVVVIKGHYKIPLLESVGMKLVANTENHSIYRYELCEPANYALIDYSDVEHKFSYRRIK